MPKKTESEATVIKKRSILQAANQYCAVMVELKALEKRKKELQLTITLGCTGPVNAVGPLKVTLNPGRWTLDEKALEEVLVPAGIHLDEFKKQGDDFWKIEALTRNGYEIENEE